MSKNATLQSPPFPPSLPSLFTTTPRIASEDNLWCSSMKCQVCLKQHLAKGRRVRPSDTPPQVALRVSSDKRASLKQPP